MQKHSLNSVKVIFANQANVKKQIQESIRQLIKRNPEIKKVILFGSYATGNYGPRSDVDILFILDSSDQPFLDRIPHYIPDDLSFSVDVFPYTASEIEALLQAENHFIRRALHEGKVLYERS